MPWLRLRVATNAQQAESTAEQLQDAGAVAVSLLPDRVADCSSVGGRRDSVIEPAPCQTPLWDAVLLEALLPLDTDLAALPALDFDVDFLADEDWSETWRRGFGPMRFGRLVVLPKASAQHARPTLGANNADVGQDVPLRLDPGLAFGTGTHPTTALCLNWLADQALARRRVLDVGTGSGILAIAALLLGAETALGIDHDPQARRAAAQNARDNGIALTVLEDLEQAHGRFDIVLANIVANTLCDLAAALTERAANLVLSGILAAQTERVMRAFPAFDFQSPVVLDGWVLLHGRHA